MFVSDNVALMEDSSHSKGPVQRQPLDKLQSTPTVY